MLSIAICSVTFHMCCPSTQIDRLSAYKLIGGRCIQHCTALTVLQYNVCDIVWFIASCLAVEVM